MREWFQNSVGKNTCILTCSNSKQTFKLYYQLSDNPVQHIWQGIHSNNTNIITGIHQGVDFDTLLDRLNYCCEQVGATKLEKPVTQDKLNRLHNQFVSHSTDSYWNEINNIIHRLESKLYNPLDDYDSSVLFFAENEQFVPIKQEYKIFLNTDMIWGRMLLGYGTLGKDWIDIATNDDNDTDLNIQSTISSETRLMFSPEQATPLYQQEKFYRWMNKTSLNVPKDLNSLSLGRYVLGQVIITDAMTDFHNNTSDWYVPDHKCKLLWNRKVFTTDTKINKVEFEDTDLFYETLMKHTDLCIK